ncbi:MAG: hypothetical protein ACE5HI_19445, partial [bacterium]
MNTWRWLLVFYFVSVTGFSTCSYAQETENPQNHIDSYYIDFAVPDLSAFTLLGVNANQISRPGNVKELAAALLEIAGTNGRISPGIAIEWTPSQTFASKNIKDYQKSHLIRAITLSFATMKDANATKLGFGLRWIPVDKSDPLMDHELQKDVRS